MSILNLLVDESKWEEFLNFKISQSNLSKSEEKNLIEFISSKKYLTVATSIINGDYTFSYPVKSMINKSGSTKKRVIYTFNEVENMILKFIVYHMSIFDNVFSKNCYSFRRNHTVKQAFSDIVQSPDISSMYAYKLDISNYFNSIDVDILLPMLKDVLSSDEPLYFFLENLLTVDKAIYNGEVIVEKRGAMAGTSISSFLANVYLMDMDKYFESMGVVYARYSDDIIIFDKDLSKLNEYKDYIYAVLRDRRLVVNDDKVDFFEPYSAWNFLGFQYSNGEIDLSDVTLKKIKDKIRRKARALYRWKVNKGKTTEHTIKVMLRVFNNKFYRERNTKDLTWCKWFFPLINTHKKLKVIDNYLVQYLRYLSSGRFGKQNYNITYEYLKGLGFRSLVNEFYKYHSK